MRRAQKFIISLFFFFYLLISLQPHLMAQDTIPSDTILLPVDTTDNPTIEVDLSLPDEFPEETVSNTPQEQMVKAPIFSGVEIGVDYLKFLSLLFDFETKYEGHLGLIFRNRYIILLEAGQGILNPEKAYKNDDYYESKGTYGRFGIGYILISDDKSNLIAGVNYGHSKFKEVIGIHIENPYGFSYEDQIIRNNLFGQWYEFTLATESIIFKSFYAGAMFRFRILRKNNEIEPFEVYSIPGYGRAFDKTIPALNLYIKYRINL